MKAIYCPGENLSLDKSTVLWQGQSIFHQYIKNKRHKHDVKFFELCESIGLILQSFIYSGIRYPAKHEICQTGAIIIKLMEEFLGKG